MISGSLSPITQNSMKRLHFGTESFLTSLTILSIECDLCRFLTYGTHTQSSYFHHLPIMSGNRTPIPQNIIRKTTLWHREFSHISHNFVNKI